uniref:TH1 domain-containing protein n=1 Tax=Kalanchoe fedtschenkoi TaxID=63787 RepID=A0A7N0T3H6_KALFE
MDGLRSHRPLHVNVPSDAPVFDDDGHKASLDEEEPSMGGDYLDVPSIPRLINILRKQGDNKVLFADKVLKFTGTGKMKKRILVITTLAMYMVDPDTISLKRRVTLMNVDKISFSELSDNFFAITIPVEYDLLIASTRKAEIVAILVDAVKGASDHELQVESCNSS